jgi:hypothetical protein
MSETEYTKGFRAGQQSYAYETYMENILYSQTRELAGWHPEPQRVKSELEHALELHAKYAFGRWQDWPEGDDHLIRGID